MTCSTKKPSNPCILHAHFSEKHGLVLWVLGSFQSKASLEEPLLCVNSSSLRHAFMTETPGARDWLGEGADSWTGQLGDNKDQKSLVHHSTRHMLIGAALDSGQGWKIHPAFLFTAFVTISLCFFSWDLSRENPKPFQYGTVTESEAVRKNRHLEIMQSSPSLLLKLP